MKVYHATYGEGVVLSKNDNMTTVHFDSGLTLQVNNSELSQVLHS